MPDVSQLEPLALYIIISRWTTDLTEEAIQWDIAHYNPAVGLKLFRSRRVEGGECQCRLDFNPDDEDMNHMDRAIVIMKIGAPNVLWPIMLAAGIQLVKENWPEGTDYPGVDRYLRRAFEDQDKYMARLVVQLYIGRHRRAVHILDQSVASAIRQDRQPPVCDWFDVTGW
ncbi:hypothetical protein CALVIDRAFT_538740 [Calocera viscosa TUFC12733]|uniref:Uncharacterized protein n=1 Tax=Calocera viscosa (strain TUFC12733) TaxID=1330018 RepID=A0A167KG84_CALVF|nr:hypothetical protein CALVIDRAFT_538740 [Calocera viscosa TUFC12733]